MRKLANAELKRLTPEAYKQTPKNNFVLVLDNVRSLNNVGSAFRTGDAFLVEKIYLCGITGTPPHREIHKTALGATDSVEWEYAAKTIDLVQQLKSAGYCIVVLEQTAQSVMLQHFAINPQQRYAFVFGNEIEGVSEEVVAIADYAVEIPQFGTKHSINISVSIGMVVWDYFCKTLPPPTH